MTSPREVKESPMPQGDNESIVYTLTTTPWGSNPTGVSVTVYDITDGEYEDVTATVMPTNEPSVAGDVITLSPLEDLTDGHLYRVEIAFTCGSSDFEAYGIVIGGR